MTVVSKTMTVNLPADKVWTILSDFGGLHKFHPKVKNSPLLTEDGPGLNCTRRCEFYDGSSVVERVTHWDEGKGFTMEMSDFSMPILTATARMEVTPVSQSKSDVTILMDFVPKFGPIGVIMANVMMRPFMKSVFAQVIKGLEWHGQTGQLVGEDNGHLAAAV